MREIKFRAWDKDCNFWAKDHWKLYLNGGVSIESTWATNNVELCQFTGLLDKNGKEIYEGDIVKYGKFALNDTKKYGENSWHNLPAGVNDDDISTVIGVFEINFTPKGLTSIDSMINNNPDVFGVEIIGNIYENPELLT